MILSLNQNSNRRGAINENYAGVALTVLPGAEIAVEQPLRLPTYSPSRVAGVAATPAKSESRSTCTAGTASGESTPEDTVHRLP